MLLLILKKYWVEIIVVLTILAATVSVFVAGKNYGEALVTKSFSEQLVEKQKAYSDLLEVVNEQNKAVVVLYTQTEAARKAQAVAEAKLRGSIAKSKKQASEALSVPTTTCVETIKKLQELR